jgi:hypothetical protein
MNNRRIERTLLDLSESRTQGIPDSAATSLVREKVVDAPEFAQLVAAAQRDRNGKDKVGKTILHELVSEFIKPVVADPRVLSSDRAIAILEQLLTVLPQLKESEEFKRLASTVLGEEIEQRRDLRARCFEDTPIDSGAAVELGVAQMGEGS